MSISIQELKKISVLQELPDTELEELTRIVTSAEYRKGEFVLIQHHHNDEAGVRQQIKGREFGEDG